ncbi:MAG: hypothetical protein Q9227_000731 [Pyrenula ochraceoflavens]
MLIFSLLTLTALLFVSTAWSLPAASSDHDITRRNENDDGSTSAGRNFALASTVRTAHPAKLEKIYTTWVEENDDSDDSDDTCSSDISSTIDFLKPSTTSVPLSSASSATAELEGLAHIPDATCSLTQRGLSRRSCSGKYDLTYDGREFSIEYRDWPQQDILWERAFSNRKWYPVKVTRPFVHKRKFENGMERDTVTFPKRDRDGKDVFFFFDRDSKPDSGQGRFIRGFKKTGSKWESVRPYVITEDLSTRWGRVSSDGFTDPESIPKLWDDKTGDGLKKGYDKNGVALTYNWLAAIRAMVPISKRCAVFYTGSGVRQEMIDKFVNKYLKGRGYTYVNLFAGSEIRYGLLPRKKSSVSEDYYTKMHFMAIYRGSRSVAQMTRSPDVPAQKSNGVPVTIGVGQVWYWVELPVLLRNPYVKRIWAVMPDREGNWIFNKQWDIEDPNTHKVDWTWPTSLDDKLQVDPIKGTVS